MVFFKFKWNHVCVSIPISPKLNWAIFGHVTFVEVSDKIANTYASLTPRDLLVCYHDLHQESVGEPQGLPRVGARPRTMGPHALAHSKFASRAFKLEIVILYLGLKRHNYSVGRWLWLLLLLRDICDWLNHPDGRKRLNPTWNMKNTDCFVFQKVTFTNEVTRNTSSQPRQAYSAFSSVASGPSLAPSASAAWSLVHSVRLSRNSCIINCETKAIDKTFWSDV